MISYNELIVAEATPKIVLGEHFPEKEAPHLIRWDAATVRALADKPDAHIILDGLCTSFTPQEQLSNIKLPTNGKRMYVRGDPFYYYNGVELPGNTQVEMMEKDTNGNNLVYVTELIGPAILGATMLAIIENSEKISRRSFIKLGSALGYALLGGSALRGVTIPIVSKPDTIEYKIAEKLMPIVARQDWWLNGRTACLVEKSLDHSGKYKVPTILVMGRKHISNISDIYSDPETRKQWLQKYIDTATSNLWKYQNQLCTGTSSLEQIRLSVKEYIEKYDVVEYGFDGKKDICIQTVSTDQIKI